MVINVGKVFALLTQLRTVARILFHKDVFLSDHVQRYLFWVLYLFPQIVSAAKIQFIR
jgi:hypothetical protein